MDRIIELALGANLELDLAVSGPGTLIVVYAAEPSDPMLPTRRLMNANVTFRFVLLYSVPASELTEAVAWANGALVTGSALCPAGPPVPARTTSPPPKRP